jgi:uncharacterized membrane protein
MTQSFMIGQDIDFIKFIIIGLRVYIIVYIYATYKKRDCI